MSVIKYRLESVLPRIIVPSWMRMRNVENEIRGFFPPGAQLAVFQDLTGLQVILTLEQDVWLHLSVSRARELPSWQALKTVKKCFLGDRFAVQILPPKKHYVNVHEHTLHLYCRVDDEPIIPDELWKLDDDES